MSKHCWKATSFVIPVFALICLAATSLATAGTLRIDEKDRVILKNNVHPWHSRSSRPAAPISICRWNG